MDANKVKEIEKAHVMQTYGRFDLVIDHGKGAYVYDADGKKYLDSSAESPAQLLATETRK